MVMELVNGNMENSQFASFIYTLSLVAQEVSLD